MACALRRYGVTDSGGNHGGSTWSEIDADHQPITDHAMAQDDRRRDAGGRHPGSSATQQSQIKTERGIDAKNEE
jgi:hypothetical protein